MALNNVDLQGNLCKDVELLQTSNGGTYLKNTIAVQRNYVRDGEERQSDFISILAYGKNAEHISKYFKKGSQILINGEIRTGSYDKEDGTKVYTTDIIVNRTYFCGSKKDNETTLSNINEQTAQSFEQAMASKGIEFTAKSDDLPF